MKTYILIVIATLFTLSLSAQNNVIYGEVSVFKNLKLKNILVKAKEAGTSVLTDSTGNFVIVCNSKDVLSFESDAFNPKKIRVKPKTEKVFVNLEFIGAPGDMLMAVENGNIERENIPIGYGSVSRQNSTFAISSMNNNAHDDFCSYSDIYSLIKGKCPGVSVMGSYSPGADQEIIIRGKTSINSKNTALYIVDGIETASLSYISPCDVKSISFLKDASASIYGSRGATGVVLIETIKAGYSQSY